MKEPIQGTELRIHAEPTVDPRIPDGELRAGRYALRFARDEDDLRKVQRLRYRVFNEELGEGLAASRLLGLDIDPYDSVCHHLVVVDTRTDAVVGTYRVLLRASAGQRGFYSHGEFDLGAVPDDVLDESVEAGRACVDREHRNGRVVQLLWRGLAAYLEWNDKRYLFGCCSVPTLNTLHVERMRAQLAESHAMHPTIALDVQPAFRAGALSAPHDHTEVELPPLFQSYLRLGAKVLGGPAYDREFRVTDFLVLLDTQTIEAHVRRAFFGRLTPRVELSEPGLAAAGRALVVDGVA